MDINKNLGELMKEAQKMQERMQKAQEKLSNLVLSGKAGTGALSVEVEMNGRHDVTKVKINPALLEDDVELLEDLVAAAVNDAVHKIEKASKEEISALTAGLNIPTDFMKDKE